MSNAKYLAHLPHQTQKWRFMRCAKSQKLYNMATVSLQICNLQRYEQMLQKFYCFIFPFLSPLSSFFLFSSLSLSGSLSLLPVLVPSLFDQSEMFTSNDDGVAPATTARSATLDQPRSISPTLQPRSISLMLSHARSHPEAAVDLTLFPLLSVRLSLCHSLVVGFFFFLAAIWVDLMVVVGRGLWAVTVAVVVGCGGGGCQCCWW